MEATVDRVFEQFDTVLKIQNRQQDLVLRRSQAIINQLDKAGLGIVVGNLFGSYSRDTAIRPLSQVNIDLLIVLDGDKHKRWSNPEGAQSAANVMQDKLARHYPDVKVGSHGVVVPFEEFRLNVAPGFAWHSGGFLIPNKTRSRWVFANPDNLADRISALNERQSGKIIPIIRMVKAWNREIGSPIEPLHIETMVYRHFTDSTRSAGFLETYPQLLSEFFGAMPAYLSGRVTEPDFEQQVDSYLDERWSEGRREEVVEHACFAAELATAAEHQLRTEGERLAIATWRQLFGRVFPA